MKKDFLLMSIPGLLCWCRSKIVKFHLHFHTSLARFSIFAFSFCDLWKKNPEKAQISWIWSKVMLEYNFWPFGGSRAEKLPWVYGGQIDPPSPGNVIPDLSRNREGFYGQVIRLSRKLWKSILSEFQAFSSVMQWWQ